MPRYSKSDPDRILAARLNGRAQRLAANGGSIKDAVADLEAMAHGRSDLLAQEAGLMAGWWSVKGGTGNFLVATGLLVMAGANHEQLQHWTVVGRKRAATPMHGEPDVGVSGSDATDEAAGLREDRRSGWPERRLL